MHTAVQYTTCYLQVYCKFTACLIYCVLCWFILYNMSAKPIKRNSVQSTASSTQSNKSTSQPTPQQTSWASRIAKTQQPVDANTLTQTNLQSHDTTLQKPAAATKSPTVSTHSVSQQSTEPQQQQTQHKPSTQQSDLFTQLKQGSTIVLFTRLGERITGTIYTYSPNLHTLIIEQPNNTYTILNTNTISIESVTPGSTPYTLPQPLTTQQIDTREHTALQQRKHQANRIGHNVSSDAQRLFDAFSRTLKCRWNEQNIIVSDCVQIDAPTYNSVKAITTEGQKSIERVKRMLAGERVRLGIS